MTNTKFQYLRDKVKVTEYKNGCIYRTKTIGRVWTDIRECYVVNADDVMYCGISDAINMEFSKTMRRVSVDTPSEVNFEE